MQNSDNDILNQGICIRCGGRCTALWVSWQLAKLVSPQEEKSREIKKVENHDGFRESEEQKGCRCGDRNTKMEPVEMTREFGPRKREEKMIKRREEQKE